MTATNGTVQIGSRISKTEVAILNRIAQREERKLAEIIRRAIRYYLVHSSDVKASKG